MAVFAKKNAFLLVSQLKKRCAPFPRIVAVGATSPTDVRVYLRKEREARKWHKVSPSGKLRKPHARENVEK